MILRQLPRFLVVVLIVVVVVVVSHVLALQAPFKVKGNHFFYLNGTQVPFLRGVNVGITKPSYFPSDKILSYPDYLRYFGYCQSMHVNTIRVYTSQPPSFYHALNDYNTMHPSQPLMLLHGIWAPDEEMTEDIENDCCRRGNDAFNETISKHFRNFIDETVERIVAAPPLSGSRGHSHPVSVAQWTLGLLIGVEWSPTTVNKTNALHPNHPHLKGTFFETTSQASPFEIWLAEMLEYAAVQSSKKGWVFPTSFVNWVTTDPLDNWVEPTYPGSMEDYANVDGRHIVPTTLMRDLAGYYANEHIYPYYPDFLEINPIEAGVPLDKLNGVDDQDPSGNYIERIVRHYEEMPFIVSEIGLPTSIGRTSPGPLNRHHGGLDEVESGEMLEELIYIIKNKGAQGVLLFQLFDEYFKKTWNIMDVEFKDRKPMWHNVLSSEQYYGMYAVQPIRPIDIDGREEDDETWLHQESYANVFDATIDTLSYAVDTEFFYLKVKKKNGDWNDDDLLRIGIDSIPLAGSTLYGNFDIQADFLFTLVGTDLFLAFANEETDYFTRRFGEYFPDHSSNAVDGFNSFRLMIRYPTNRIKRFDRRSGCSKPDMGSYCTKDKALYHDLMHMRKGFSNPDHPSYSNLATWNLQKNVLEARIPWGMIGFGDPSSKRVTTFEGKGEELRTIFIEVPSIFIQARYGSEKVTAHAHHAIEATWSNWNSTRYEERPKKTAQYITRAFQTISADPHCTDCSEGVPLPPLPPKHGVGNGVVCDLEFEESSFDQSTQWIETKWFSLLGARNVHMTVEIMKNTPSLNKFKIVYHESEPNHAYQDRFRSGVRNELNFRIGGGLVYLSIPMKLTVSYTSDFFKGGEYECVKTIHLMLDFPRLTVLPYNPEMYSYNVASEEIPTEEEEQTSHGIQLDSLSTAFACLLILLLFTFV